MQFPISLGLHRSTLLLFLLILFHALAAASVIVLPWATVLRAALLLALGVSLGHALRPSPIRGLRLLASDRLECLLADGRRVSAKTLPDSVVFSRLLVLGLRLGEEKRSIRLVVLPDQLSAEEFRVLRLWLRWQGEPRKGKGAGSAF